MCKSKGSCFKEMKTMATEFVDIDFIIRYNDKAEEAKERLRFYTTGFGRLMRDASAKIVEEDRERARRAELKKREVEPECENCSE